ncbi:MAG: hypothetical protein JHC39_07420 [Lentimicrobium sp.]|nr:hypothetical protein [Lentimicrobium sp.]
MEKIKYTDIVLSEGINFQALETLVSNINANACYDKVGETFYQLEEDLKEGIVNSSTVQEFLGDLIVRKATSENIGFINDKA